MPVFDSHNDTLLTLHLPNRSEGRTFFARSELGHLDLPRAQDGGFGGGFFACYVPNPEDERTEESALRELVRECNRVGVLLDLSHLNERGFALRSPRAGRPRRERKSRARRTALAEP